MANTYSNFQDPFGLVLRMLRSKDRAAWFALQMAALGFLVHPLDRAWEASERKLLEDAAPSSLPILLIVGAPRSGTTLLYQMLAHFLPLSYFNNFSALFSRAPITASVKLSHFNKEQRADYHSYYGNTTGWTAPNDGFHMWNRWLENDRYSVPENLSPAVQQDMQRFFNAWFASFPKPFLNKNNRNTACIPLLATALPNAYFIEVRREPAFVVQSLLQARKHIQGSKTIGWGLASTSAHGTTMRDYVTEVCAQVFHIDQMLQQARSRVAPDHFISVSYEDFCRAPADAVKHIANACLGTSVDKNRLERELQERELQPIETTNQVRLTSEEFDLIQRGLQELYENHATKSKSDSAEI